MVPPLASRVLARHWRAVAMGVTATVILTVMAVVLVPVKYEAKALIVLLPPSSTVGNGGNPYTELGGLDTAAGVLSLAMNTKSVDDAIAQTSRSASFLVEKDAATSGPVLRLTVDDRDPLTTLHSLDTLVAQADPTLAKLQSEAGAPRNLLIRVSLVTRESSATVVRQEQIRAVLAVAAVGVILTGLVIAAVDRRSRARMASTSDDADQTTSRETPESTNVAPPTNLRMPRSVTPPNGADNPPPSNSATQPIAGPIRTGMPSPGPRPSPRQRDPATTPPRTRALADKNSERT